MELVERADPAVLVLLRVGDHEHHVLRAGRRHARRRHLKDKQLAASRTDYNASVVHITCSPVCSTRTYFHILLKYPFRHTHTQQNRRASATHPEYAGDVLLVGVNHIALKHRADGELVVPETRNNPYN